MPGGLVDNRKKVRRHHQRMDIQLRHTIAETTRLADNRIDWRRLLSDVCVVPLMPTIGYVWSKKKIVSIYLIIVIRHQEFTIFTFVLRFLKKLRRSPCCMNSTNKHSGALTVLHPIMLTMFL